ARRTGDGGVSTGEMSPGRVGQGRGGAPGPQLGAPERSRKWKEGVLRGQERIARAQYHRHHQGVGVGLVGEEYQGERASRSGAGVTGESTWWDCGGRGADGDE
ncbi:unnamed protein product, partial [Discosporangium mesarthrocarpum]